LFGVYTEGTTAACLQLSCELHTVQVTPISQYLMGELDINVMTLLCESQTKRHSNFIFEGDIPVTFCGS